MDDEEKFIDWSGRIKKKNDVLKNTNFHHSDESLCDFLQHHLCSDLAQTAYSSFCPDGTALRTVRDLSKWERDVRKLDEKRWDARRMVRKVVEAEHKRIIKLSKDKQGSMSGQKSYKATEKRVQPKEARDAPPDRRCPRLTQGEKAVLEKYNGCFRCRQTLVNHGSKNCPNGWPSADDYEVLRRPSTEILKAFLRAGGVLRTKDSLTEGRRTDAVRRARPQRRRVHTPTKRARPRPL